MPSENYYIIDQKNTPQGPYTLLRLRAFYNAGDIKADDLVCQEGDEKWVPLESLFLQPKRKPAKHYRLFIELLVKLKTIFTSNSLVSFSCGIIGGLFITLAFSHLTSHKSTATLVPTSLNHEKNESPSNGFRPANLPADVVPTAISKKPLPASLPTTVKGITIGQKKDSVEYLPVTLLQIESRLYKYGSSKKSVGKCEPV